MPRYITDEEFTHLRNTHILYEGYVIGVGYAYKSTIDPGRDGSHGLKCNLATINAQFVDVSHEAYNRSFLETETVARQSSTHFEPHWKEKLSDYPYHKVDGDNEEDPDEDKVVSSLIALLRVMCSIKLSGSGDHVGNGRTFSSGTFLTLTSKHGGFGPAIHSSGNINIIFVDIDTLPGLLGLAKGKGKPRYKSRSGHENSALAKAIKEVTVANEVVNGRNALIKVKTSVQQALMTEIRAGDRIFNNGTDSALVTGKSAWEMASVNQNNISSTYSHPDSAAWPVANFRGVIYEYRIGSFSEYKINKGIVISKEQKDSLNQRYPLPSNSSVNFWKNHK